MNLKELSRQLNLSQTTVSRALNGYPEVSEATRKRVFEAAARTGYRPSLRARNLATGRAMSIGHIIPLSRQNELVNMVFSDFMAGAGLVYADQGYTMTLSIVEDGKELETYRQFAEGGVVDGVIVQAPRRDEPRIAHLKSLGLPFIVHGRASDVATPYAWLDVNNTRAIDTATTHLIELGHRRIALVNGPETMDFAARRKTGYCDALQRAGIAIDPHLIRAGDMSEPNGFGAALALLQQAQAPTAFVASSILLALGIKRGIEARGLRLGTDVSVICFDDEISFLPNAGTPPIFTAMQSSVRAAGARCARLLLAQIANPQEPVAQELWEAHLIHGSSVGPGPQA